MPATIPNALISNYLIRIGIIFSVLAFAAHEANAGKRVATADRSIDALAKPSGDVWLYAENLGEEVKVNIYKRDGRFDDAALAKLDDLFRCVRTGAVRAVRPQLYEHLSRIYDHFGGKRIELISGFRFVDPNSSRHYHASAMDIRIPGVSLRAQYAFATQLDTGDVGIGLYPTSHFIHIDFRAPGERSYRWVDRSGPDDKRSTRRRPRTQPARVPTS